MNIFGPKVITAAILSVIKPDFIFMVDLISSRNLVIPHTVRTKLTAQSSHRPRLTTSLTAYSVRKSNVEPRVLHVFSNEQVHISYGLKLSVFGFCLPTNF